MRNQRLRSNVVQRSLLRQIISILSATTLVIALLSGCGEVSKIYAKNSALGIYFTVPAGWHKISEEDIRSFELEGADAAGKNKADLVLWQEAYSENHATSARNILQLQATKSLTAFARVRALTTEESDAMSYNGLRNLILPVTELISGSSQVVDDFQLLDEREIVSERARGLETIFSFTPKDGENETVHQTALLSTDRSSIYFFLVRCTTNCFDKSQGIVDEIVASFTVKGRR